MSQPLGSPWQEWEWQPMCLSTYKGGGQPSEEGEPVLGLRVLFLPALGAVSPLLGTSGLLIPITLTCQFLTWIGGCGDTHVLGDTAAVTSGTS